MPRKVIRIDVLLEKEGKAEQNEKKRSEEKDLYSLELLEGTGK